MGANPTQAFAISLFLLAFVALAAGMAWGGNLLTLLAGVTLLAASAYLFRRAKRWEEQGE